MPSLDGSGARGSPTSRLAAPSQGFPQRSDRAERPEKRPSDSKSDACASDCDGDEVFACYNARRCYTATPGEPNPWFTAFYSTPCERTSAAAAATFAAATGLVVADKCAG